MAYRLPTFNTEVYIWRYDSDVSNPPDVIAIANFCIGRRISGGDYWTTSTPRDWYCTSWLLLPPGTDIRGDVGGEDQGDTAEIPAGSGRYYHVFFSDVSAMGFDNEHMAAIVARIPGSPTPPDLGEILLEDDTALLLEDDTAYLLE